ncbi:MAG: hypothetical protein ACE5K8_03020 [Candidatus Zixiibacteriota bacterium]
MATNYRQYLNPEIISKLKGMEIWARMVVEGFIVGMHRLPYHGFSVGVLSSSKRMVYS